MSKVEKYVAAKSKSMQKVNPLVKKLAKNFALELDWDEEESSYHKYVRKVKNGKRSNHLKIKIK